jgi:hypothetical protein
MQSACLFSDASHCLKIQQSIEEILKGCSDIFAHVQTISGCLPDEMDFLRRRLKAHVTAAHEAISARKLAEARLYFAEIKLLKYQIELAFLDTKKDPEDFIDVPKKIIQIHTQGQIEKARTYISQMKHAAESERINKEYVLATEFQQKIEISATRDHEIHTFIQTLIRLLDDDSIIDKPSFLGVVKQKIADIKDNYKKFDHVRCLFNYDHYSIAAKPFFADFILGPAEVKTLFRILSDLAPENLFDKTRLISELHQTLKNKKPVESPQRPLP